MNTEGCVSGRPGICVVEGEGGRLPLVAAQDHWPSRPRPRSPATDATEPPTFRMLVASEGCCLAQGRRGPAYLGLMPSGGEPVAIQVISRDTVSLHPPPVHPNLNRILRRVEEGELNFEMRALCDGGVSATPRAHTRATTPRA